MTIITAKVRLDNQNLKYHSFIVCIPKNLINLLEIKQGDMLTVKLMGKLSKNGIYTKFEGDE